MEDSGGGRRWRTAVEDSGGGRRWRTVVEDGGGGCSGGQRWRTVVDDGDGGEQLNRGTGGTGGSATRSLDVTE